MKIRILITINIIIVSSIFFISCKTLQRSIKDDNYSIINMELEQARKTKDSVFIINWGNHYNFSKEKIFEIKNDSNSISYFKKFLNDQGINFDEEISYFEKQLEKPFDIDESKITVDNVLVFPTSKNNLKFNRDYSISDYFMNLNRPLFTRDGKKAIIYISKIGSQNYFSLFKKVNGKWKRTLDYFYPLPIID